MLFIFITLFLTVCFGQNKINIKKCFSKNGVNVYEYDIKLFNNDNNFMFKYDNNNYDDHYNDYNNLKFIDKHFERIFIDDDYHILNKTYYLKSENNFITISPFGVMGYYDDYVLTSGPSIGKKTNVKDMIFNNNYVKKENNIYQISKILHIYYDENDDNNNNDNNDNNVKIEKQRNYMNKYRELCSNDNIFMIFLKNEYTKNNHSSTPYLNDFHYNYNYNSTNNTNNINDTINHNYRTSSDIDYALFQNLDYNIDATYVWYNQLILCSSLIMQNGIGHTYSSMYLKIYTTPDHYPNDDPCNLLDYIKKIWGRMGESFASLYSGKTIGNTGCAWRGSLCDTNYFFAIISHLDGYFPYPMENYNHWNWDIIITSHEHGHIFNGIHTHELNPPIDRCAYGDCSNAKGATIMSYCQICPGGVSNIDLRYHEINNDQMRSFTNGRYC